VGVTGGTGGTSVVSFRQQIFSCIPSFTYVSSRTNRLVLTSLRPLHTTQQDYQSIIDQTTRVKWDREPSFTPLSTSPDFTTSLHPSLCFHLHAMSGHARASTLYFPSRPSISRKEPVSVATPIFMPVGTKGTIKSMSYEEVRTDEERRMEGWGDKIAKASYRIFLHN